MVLKGDIAMNTTLKETTLDRPWRNMISKAGPFLWHFAQMVLAMEAGMMIYHKLLWPLLEPTPFAALTDTYPLLGYWMMIVSMAFGMLVLMRYHKSTWRYCMEMTGAMFIPLVVLTALVLFELCPAHILYGFGDPLMFFAMAAFMIVRPAKHAHRGKENSCH
jgi:hypothetical protein